MTTLREAAAAGIKKTAGAEEDQDDAAAVPPAEEPPLQQQRRPFLSRVLLFAAAGLASSFVFKLQDPREAYLETESRNQSFNDVCMTLAVLEEINLQFR